MPVFCPTAVLDWVRGLMPSAPSEGCPILVFWLLFWLLETPVSTVLPPETDVRSGASTPMERGIALLDSDRGICWLPNSPRGAPVLFEEPLRTGCPMLPLSGAASTMGAAPPPEDFGWELGDWGRRGNALGTLLGTLLGRSPLEASVPLETFPDRPEPVQGAGAGVEPISPKAARFSAAVGAVNRTCGPPASFALPEDCWVERRWSHSRLMWDLSRSFPAGSEYQPFDTDTLAGVEGKLRTEAVNSTRLGAGRTKMLL
jgi:hypothetical protein